jgi:hypothetical protein
MREQLAPSATVADWKSVVDGRKRVPDQRGLALASERSRLDAVELTGTYFFNGPSIGDGVTVSKTSLDSGYVYAALRSTSSRVSDPAIWFQLVKFRLTTYPVHPQRPLFLRSSVSNSLQNCEFSVPSSNRIASTMADGLRCM